MKSIEFGGTHGVVDRKDCLKTLSAILIPAWFVLILAAALVGAFNAGNNPPILLGMAATVPVVVFGFFFWRTPQFREIVSAVSPPFLTLAHTMRIAAIVFLIEYSRGTLPAMFAFPAAFGDIFMGVTAPLMAWLVASKRVTPRRLLTWNSLGLLDLISAVMLGVLCSGSPVGILAKNGTTEAMGQFPLVLIPTFFVPLLAIFHLISISRARSLDREAN
ncbi:MAG TPA: hypothetical protein VN761_03020 [Candidatus Polarisedimenticolia bacterium]|nr:hypothetical protein [Candidatus Polarisedimenticolia bacterium]